MLTEITLEAKSPNSGLASVTEVNRPFRSSGKGSCIGIVWGTRGSLTALQQHTRGPIVVMVAVALM